MEAMYRTAKPELTLTFRNENLLAPGASHAGGGSEPKAPCDRRECGPRREQKRAIFRAVNHELTLIFRKENPLAPGATISGGSQTTPRANKALFTEQSNPS